MNGVLGISADTQHLWKSIVKGYQTAGLIFAGADSSNSLTDGMMRPSVERQQMRILRSHEIQLAILRASVYYVLHTTHAIRIVHTWPP